MNPDEYVVVWCDSPQGLLTTRVDRQFTPMTFDRALLPPEVYIPEDVESIFTVLGRKDGTKVAVPFKFVNTLFGWEF